ncbi:hypothetical protein PIB30_071372 [Stylosanthes scabra]|uniref:Uncharacterized protein n=1 Tax=Stylosanthes scabra TaxID=79078 RepID=A0ABU6UMI5_9FABA|nr:hypothetical protein [Stylosanthes scabra]
MANETASEVRKSIMSAPTKLDSALDKEELHATKSGLDKEAHEERSMETTDGDPLLVDIMGRLRELGLEHKVTQRLVRALSQEIHQLTDVNMVQRRLLELLIEPGPPPYKRWSEEAHVLKKEYANVRSRESKTKLEFSTEELGEEMIEVMQEGRGTPFTFHSHDGPFMIGEDMPHMSLNPFYISLLLCVKIIMPSYLSLPASIFSVFRSCVSTT